MIKGKEKGPGKKTVLIVDDSATNLKLLKVQLEDVGWKVFVAGDGVKAIEVLKQEGVDVVVSDILMPKMDGYRLCYELKRNKKWEAIPFIFYTATYTSPSDEKLALQLGGAGFLRKPSSTREISDAMRAAVSGSRPKPDHVRVFDKEDVMREYSTRLVAKLEQKNIELEGLTHELRRLSTVVEQTADLIIITDEEGMIQYVNPSIEKFTGYSQEELLGKTPRVLKSGRQSEEFYRNLWQRITRGEVFHGTFINKKKNGELYYEEQTITPLVDKSERIVNFVSTGKNVTEQRKDRDALDLANAQLRNLFDSIDEVLFSFDTVNSKLLLISPACAKIYGRSQAAFFENSSLWKEVVHPDDKGLAEVLDEQLNAGKPAVSVYRVLRPDGTARWIETRARPTMDGKGKLIRFDGVVIDITDRMRAEEGLRESERRFREMLGNVELLATTLNKEGKVTFCNDYLLRLTGWSREEALGADWFLTFLPNEAVEVKKLFFDSLVTGTAPIHYENPIITRNGELRDIFWSNTLLLDAEGQVVGMASIGEDVTERKQYEKKLESEHALLRTIIDAIPDEICVKDMERKFLVANAGAVRALKRNSRDEVLGKRDEDLIAPQFAREATEEENRIFETGEPILNKEARPKINPDTGAIERAILTSKIPLRNSSGAITGLVTVNRDITDLKIQTSYFRQLFDNSPSPIIMVDMKDQVFEANRSFMKLFQFSLQEVIGKKIQDLIVPDDFQKEAEAFSHAVARGETMSKETKRKKKDGTLVDTTVVAYPILVDNKPVRSYRVYVDETDQKKLEAQLLRTQRLESIGTLAGGIAHDLNNVLGPIQMGIEIIRKKTSDLPSLRMMEMIEKNVQRGASIVRQILTFARGMEGERAPLQLGHLIADIEKMMKETFQRDIRIERKVPRELWIVKGDATQLYQVIMNLCVNARDAMPQGGNLRIQAENFLSDEHSVAVHQDAKPGPYVLLKVADTGTGMTPDVMNKIFDPFFTTKEVGKGTGLGLSTTLGIVKQHGGFITVYSEVRRGTEFRIYLPAEVEAGTITAMKKSEAPAEGHGEMVLLVDDEVALNEIVRAMLESHQYKVITANDGTEAVARFSEHKVEVKVLITDLMMPYMDGPATIRAIRRIDPTVKIIVTSGLTDEIKQRQLSDFPDIRYLNKPYATSTLLNTLSEILQGRKS